MKLSTTATGILALLLLGAGYGLRTWQDRPTVAQRVIQHSADSLQTAGISLDSAIAARHAGDSALVAEPLQRQRVHLQHAESLGDSVAHLQVRTDAAIARAATSDSAREHAMAALGAERMAHQRTVDELRQAVTDGALALFNARGIIRQDSVDLVAMRGQRDKAQHLLDQALALKHGRCGVGPSANVNILTANGLRVAPGLGFSGTCLL